MSVDASINPRESSGSCLRRGTTKRPAAPRRRSNGRGARLRTLWLEGLEDRRLLATITWNTTTEPDGGPWNSGNSWVGGVVPSNTDNAVIKGLAGSGIVTIAGAADSVVSLTTDNSVSLQVSSGSLTLGTGTASTLGGSISVASGASLDIDTGAMVYIADEQSIDVNGQLSITGATIYMEKLAYDYATYGIAVEDGGTMEVTNSTFKRDGSDSETTEIQVDNGGQMTASGSTFAIDDVVLEPGSILGAGDITTNQFSATLTAPVTDIQNLTDNQSFAAVDVTGGLSTDDDVTLAPLGTLTTAGQTYVIPSGLTVPATATLTIATGATVYIDDDETISVSGDLTITGASVIMNKLAYDYATYGITVSNGGTITATNSTFSRNGSDSETTEIQVDNGGLMTASGSTFGIDDVVLEPGSLLESGDINTSIFTATLTVPVGDITLLTNNQSFAAVDVTGGLLTNQDVTLAPLGTQTTTGQTYVVPSGLTVPATATLTIATGATVYIDDDETISVSGNLTITGASVIMNKLVYDYSTYGITVNGGGVLGITGSSFTKNGGDSETTEIQVDNGGQMTATGSTFAIDDVVLEPGSIEASGDITTSVFSATLTAPVSDVSLLTDNESFAAVDVTGGLSTNEDLTLAPLGTLTTTGQTYVIPSGLTVPATATLTIATGATVYIDDDETISVSGNLTITGASVIMNQLVYDYATYGITVNNGGVLTITSSSFDNNGGDSETTEIQVANGGQITAAGSTFAIDDVVLEPGSIIGSDGIITSNFGSTVTVPITDITLLTNNQSFAAVYVTGGLTSGQDVTLAPLGTLTTAGQAYYIAGGISVASNASLTIGTGATLYIDDAETLSVTGQLTITDSTVYMNKIVYDYATYGITVNNGGVMVVSGSTFSDNGGDTETTEIHVENGGHMTASGSTFSIDAVVLDAGSILSSGDITTNVFNSPLTVPIGDVTLLTTNQSFGSVRLTGTVLDNELVALDPLGTLTTADQSYTISSTVTVALGGTLDIGQGATVYIADEESISVSGKLNITDATIDIDKLANDEATYGITVNNGGAMTATGSTFGRNGTDTETTEIEVASEGNLTITNSSLGIDNVTLSSGSGDTISTVAFMSGTFDVNSGATLDIVDDDFSYLGSESVVAFGTQGTTIDMENNFWGATTASDIEAKILDGNTDPSSDKPAIDFQNWLDGSSGTSAVPLSTTYTPGSQTITLTANVTTAGGVSIDQGYETFTILEGTEVIGATSAQVLVSNGQASTQYTLPPLTSAGLYIIEASYLGSADYPPALDTSHFLTINPAPTDTIASTNESLNYTYSDAANQSITLSAQVSSSSPGAVNEGQVTFTILSGGNPVGAAVTGQVSGNTAQATYTLLSGTLGGTYTVQMVYTDPSDNYVTSTGTTTLTVAPAATTISSSSVTGSYSATDGEGVVLSANVSSPGGTVDEGSVQFTILSSGGATVLAESVKVVNGTASSNVTLPLGTLPGQYTIEEVYSGTPDYAPSTLSPEATLTIGAATTGTTTTDVALAYNTAAQSANLSAQVTSPGGTVTGSVTFTILNGMTVVGTQQTATLSNGTASVSYPLPPGFAAGTYTIDASYVGSSDFLTSSDESHVLTVTEPPAAMLAIVTGPPATATAGTAFATASQPIVVDEEDQFGDLEAGDNSTVVTVTLASGTGAIIGTIQETVVGGVATFTNLTYDTAQTMSLSFTSGNLAPATSGPIVVSPAAGSALILTQQPSASATAGQVFKTQPVVEEVDAFGNVIDDSTSTVTAAVGDLGTSTLLGNNLMLTLTNGMAAFSGLSYNKAETLDITFTSSVSGVASVTSQAITVAPSTPSQFVITQQPSSSATVGQPFSTQPVVYEEDQFYNVETADSTTQVTVMLARGSGPLQGPTTVTLSDGVGRFSGLYDNRAETITLDFASGIIETQPSDSIVVGPAGAAALVVSTPPSPTATAGQAFAVQPVVKIVDADGNVETGDNTTQVTVSLASGPGQLLGTTALTVKNGVAAFSGLSDQSAGTISLDFTATDGLTAGPTGSIVISPGTAQKLVIQTPPSPTATAAQAFTTQPVVYEEDQYGNLETGDSSSTVTASLATGTGPLQGTTKVTLDGGVGVFSGLNDPTAETITLQFTDGNLVSPPSSAIAIAAGPAVGLVIATQPYSTVTAGNPLTDPVVVDEVDAEGNIVTSDSSTQVTAALSSGTGDLYGTTKVTLQDGVANFNDLEDDKAGVQTLAFTAGTLPTVVAQPSTVNAAPASALVIQRPPGGIIVGSTFSVQVYAEDPYGNVDPTFNQPVSISASSGALAGTVSATAQNGVATFDNVVSDVSGSNVTLTASTTASGVTSGTTSGVTIAPGAPTKLVIQTQPVQTATAGAPFVTTTQSVVISEQDQYGNIETGDSTTAVTVGLASGPGTLAGTLSATLVDGVATFTSLRDNTAGTITLQFSGGGLTSLASDAIVISPAAASKLVVTQPPPSTATAGVALTTPLVVSEEDKFGNVETGDDGTTIAVSLASGNGPLQGMTSVVVQGGVATFADIYDELAETITLNVSGGGLSAGPTAPIVVSPAAVAQLVIEQPPSQTATAGVAFVQAPVIWEEDAFGNLLTHDNNTTITAYVASGTGTLSGATTVTVKGGIATFTTLAEDTAGTVALAFSTGGLTSPASPSITVSPAAAAKLALQAPPSATATAGQAFLAQPVVVEEDAYGNLISGDNTTEVTAKLSTAAGRLTGTSAIDVSGGIATFAGLADETAETTTLVFSAPGLASVTSGSIAVSPASASQWVLQTPPSSTATAGQPLATQPVLYEEDSYDNLITGDNTTRVTVSLASGAGPLLGTPMVTVQGGIATFTGLGDDTAETIKLGFSGGGLPAVTSAPIVVSPAAAAKLVIQTQPAQTATAGAPFVTTTQPVVVNEEDQYGNIETGDSTTAVTVGLASGPGTLAGTLSATLVDGVATFTSLRDNTAGTIALQFSGGGLTSLASDAIVISPASASKLVITQPPPSTATAGVALTTPLVVSEEDKFGNVETGDDGTTIAVSLASGSGPLQGMTSVVVQGGVATFADIYDELAETITLDVSGGGLSAGPTAPIVVSPAAAAKLVIEQPPSQTATAGVPFVQAPVIWEEDAFGNLLTHDNSTTIMAYVASGTGTLSGATTVTVKGGIATFATLAEDTAGTVALAFSGGGLTSPSSPSITVSAGQAAKLALQVPPSATATAGQSFLAQPVVVEEDAYGNLIAGDNTTAVTASLSTAAGRLTGTAAVDVKSGVATFAGLADDTAETTSLVFSAPGLSPVTSGSIMVSPAAAMQWAITTPPSSSGTAGQALSTQPVIQEEDAYGNAVTTDNTTQATVNLGTGTGTLLGTTKVTVNAGAATFAGLANDTAGTLTLVFSGGGLTSTTSQPIVINPAAAAKLVVQSSVPSTASAGQGITTPVVVAEEDQYGNVETGDNSTVITASLTATGGKLVGNDTATVQGGVATFTGLGDDTAGTTALAFSATGLDPVTSGSITVAPARATQWAITTAPSSSGIAGQPLGTQPVVTEEDQYGNAVPGDSTTQVAVTLESGSGTLLGTTTVTAKNGVATFAGLGNDTAGTLTLLFGGGGLSSVTSQSIVIDPAATSTLVVQTSIPSTATAGQPFATQPVVVEEDQYGNVETGDSTTVVSARLSSTTGILAGTTSVTVKHGVATFSGLNDQTAETTTLVFSSGTLAPVSTGSVTVSPGPAVRWEIVTQPATSAVAGQALATQPVVVEVDAYGNVETSDNSTVATVSLESGSGPLTGATSVTVSGGVARFSGLADSSSETISLAFGGGGLTPAVSTVIAITPAPSPTPSPSPSPTPTPSPAPTITSEQVLTAPKKKGKKAAAIDGFLLQYSEAMNGATAGSQGNYQVEVATIKKVKKKKVTTYTAVGVSASYNAATNSVTLNLASNQTFTDGGQITVIYSPPGGVSSASGVPLASGDAVLSIGAKGKTIAIQ